MDTTLRLRPLRIELARRNTSQQRLAKKLGVPATTLSGWIRGVHPGPPDLARRIERALKVRRGRIDATYERPAETPASKEDKS